MTEIRTPSEGKIVVTPRGHVTIHTYVAPEAGALATSQIIETAHALVIVDAQFTPAFAAEVKAYAASLAKPIERLFISHRHADHFSGAQVFGDVPIYAPAETRAFIAAHGQAMIDRFQIDAHAVTPTMTVTPGREIIDGLSFEYRLIIGAEADVNLVILLPDIATVIAQDIVYHHVHLVVDKQDVSAWRAALVELKRLPAYDLVLAGHGLPGTPAVYDQVDAYLVAVDHAYQHNATAQGAKDELLAMFPGLEAPWLVGLSVDLAFAHQ